MSVSEQINDALDDENPSATLAEIMTSLIDNTNLSDFESAFNCVKRNAKQPTIITEAINQCFDKIKQIDEKETQIDFLRVILNFLLNYPSLLKDFSGIKDLFIKLCEETQHYNYIARFYKDQGIDDSESDPAKFEHYLKIGELYLLSNVTDQANAMLNKAFNYRFIKTSPKPLLDRYENLRAEIQVANKNYEVAADILYQMSKTLQNENDRAVALKRSIIFAMVSMPGPKRDSLFRKISADEDGQLLPIFKVFDRLNKRQIITGEEIEALWNEVSSEKSISKETLESTIRLHNMTQIAYLYSVISIKRMAQIVGVSETEALSIVESMIQSNRLKAKIDQPNKMIVYTRDESHNKEISIKEFSEKVDEVTLAISRL